METEYDYRLVDEDRNEFICTDKEGNSSQYVLYKGHKFFSPSMPGNIKDRFDNVANLQCRDDDIVLMTLPKSGTHWLVNIVSMVTHGNTEYAGTPPIMEYVNIEQLHDLPSPRILHTHLTFNFIPNQIKRNKSKIITLFRNPKDVMTSFYTFGSQLSNSGWYNGSWDGFFKCYLSKHAVCETWFEHIKMWGSALQEFPDKEVLFLSYEDMKKNLFENVVKISKFLGIERSEEFYQEVATRCTFSNMKANVNKERGVDPNWANLVKDGILPIYRKGEIGDWKNWFTVAQNEIFETFFEQEMKDFDISPYYTMP